MKNNRHTAMHRPSDNCSYSSLPSTALPCALPDRFDILCALPSVLFSLTPVIEMLIRSFRSVSQTYVLGFTVYDAFVFNNAAMLISFLITLVVIGHLIIHATKAELNHNLHKCIPHVLLLGFVILMLISTVKNGFTNAALSGEANRRESLFTYILYLVTFFGCSSLIRSPKVKTVILHIFLSGSILLVIFSLINIYIFPLPGLEHYGPYSACFYNSNHYGYYLSMAISISLALLFLEHDRWEILDCAAFITNSFMLALNHTFGCVIACLCAAVLLIIILYSQSRCNHWAVILFVAIIFITSCLSPALREEIMIFIQDLHTFTNHPTHAQYAHLGHNRMQQWLYTIKLIKEKPVLGWGVEGIRETLAEHSTAERPHNEYLQYTAFFGIPAGLLYITGIVSILIKSIKKSMAKLDSASAASLAGAFAYAVSACFGVSMFYTAPFFFIFLGLSIQRDI